MSVSKISSDVFLFPVFLPFELPYLRDRFQEACRSFPEFKKDADGPYVLGSFGALSNPASFHNPFIREIRSSTYAAAIKVLKDEAKPGERVQQLFDRMCFRRAGTSFKSESWRRDACTGLKTTASDRIWEGWVNLDDADQYFTCVLDSADKYSGVESGFAACRLPSDTPTRCVAVPPGYAILFRQEILHRVMSSKLDSDSYRIFVGFRLTPSDTPLYDVFDVINRQALPPLPSGQTPAMFSTNHNSALLHRLTIPWSNRVVEDAFKEERKLPDGSVIRVVPRFMRAGLVDRGFKYADYSDHEVLMMLPHTPLSWVPGGELLEQIDEETLDY